MFVRWFTSVFLNALSLYIIHFLFDSFYIDSFGVALLASVILSMLNFMVKPILIVLTLPITIFTFGFFLFVVQAITLMIVQSLLGASFVIDGFGMAILAAILMAVLNSMMQRILK
ncbi:MAG TPA: phage holin family protein [Bacillota bacterium]|nr:phage holin family protein [Bacillota bacterium]